MSVSCRLLFLMIGFGGTANAQFFFNNFFNPQQFQRPFQFFQPTTPPTTTTTVEFIPDPDKEQGNFPMPNPANWPVGPDWNDPRNNNQQQLGWGGNGLIGTTSTKPSIVVSSTTTTTTTTTTAQPTTVIVISSTIRPIAVTKKPLPTPAAKKQPTKKRSSPKRATPTPVPATVSPPPIKTKISSASKRSSFRKSKSASRRSH